MAKMLSTICLVEISALSTFRRVERLTIVEGRVD